MLITLIQTRSQRAVLPFVSEILVFIRKQCLYHLAGEPPHWLNSALQ